MTAQRPNPQQQADDPRTPPEQLRRLAQQSIELAQVVAQNPSADSQILQKLALSSDPTISQRVAANPNTPRNFLLKLGEEFPEQLLDNPIFPLLIMEPN